MNYQQHFAPPGGYGQGAPPVFHPGYDRYEQMQQADQNRRAPRPQYDNNSQGDPRIMNFGPKQGGGSARPQEPHRQQLHRYSEEDEFEDDDYSDAGSQYANGRDYNPQANYGGNAPMHNRGQLIHQRPMHDRGQLIHQRPMHDRGQLIQQRPIPEPRYHPETRYQRESRYAGHGNHSGEGESDHYSRYARYSEMYDGLEMAGLSKKEIEKVLRGEVKSDLGLMSQRDDLRRQGTTKHDRFQLGIKVFGRR